MRSQTLPQAGLNAAFDASVSILLNGSSTTFSTVLHPCLQAGYNKTYVHLANRGRAEGGSIVRLIGDPASELCQQLVEKVRPSISKVIALKLSRQLSVQALNGNVNTAKIVN